MDKKSYKKIADMHKAEENRVTPQDALRAQALAQPKTKIILENNKSDKPAPQKTKPEDVIPNAEAKNEVKTPEKAVEAFKGQAAEEAKATASKRKPQEIYIQQNNIG